MRRMTAVISEPTTRMPIQEDGHLNTKIRMANLSGGRSHHQAPRSRPIVRAVTRSMAKEAPTALAPITNKMV